MCSKMDTPSVKDIEHLLLEAITQLRVHFGEQDDFAIDMCRPGGIEWTKWKSGEGHRGSYKTMRIWLESRRGKHTLRTFLKAFAGAPVWTISELRTFAHCLANGGQFELVESSMPSTRKLCTGRSMKLQPINDSGEGWW